MPDRLDPTCRTIYGARVHFHSDGTLAISLWREPRGLRGRVTYLVGPLEVYPTSPEHDALDQALHEVDRAFRGPYARLLRDRAAASHASG